VGLEALLLLSLGVVELFHLRAARLAMGVTTAAFFVAGAAALAWCAWALRNARRSARGPVVMAQLIQLGMAWNLRDVWSVVLPGGLALAALLVIGGLLHPATTKVLEENDRLDD